MVRVAVVLVSAVLLATGCGSGVSSTERSNQQAVAIAEQSLRSRGFSKVTLQIRHVDGSIEEHCVWLADSEIERQRGLMQVTDPSIGGGEAMVFVFDQATSGAFWMKDTVLPLSIAWVDSNGMVAGVTDMSPCPPDGGTCPEYAPPRPITMALEMAQGRLQDWGIGPGATLSLGKGC